MQDGIDIVKEMKEAELSGKLQKNIRPENHNSANDKEEFVKKLYYADDILDDMLFNIWNCL
jgi:hypothetical protein